MADLTIVAANVAPVNDVPYDHKTYIAAAAITKGQLLYEDTAGKAALADSTDDSKMIALIGCALQAAAAGRPVDVLRKGALEGMGVGSKAYGLPIYASETAGALSDAAISGTGKVNKVIGYVRSMSDSPTLSKVLYIDVSDAAQIVEL